MLLDVQFVAYRESIWLGPHLQSDMAPYTGTGERPLIALGEDAQEKKDKWFEKHCVASEKW